MADQFLSEIRLMSFPFAPKGWALCNGQLLQINQNQALYALLGNTYGGDGRTTFALPNLQGMVPIHAGAQPGGGPTYQVGQRGGEASHTLTANEIASHTHTMRAKAAAADKDMAGITPSPSVVPAQAFAIVQSGTVPASTFGTGPANTAMASNAIGLNAGGQPHPNQQPFLVLNFCIALQGIFPSRN